MTERRYSQSEIRAIADDNGKVKITGYAALFNSLSEDLGGFREKILPGAFDAVLKDDVRALWNHDESIVLGRTKSGTLRLFTDDVGLGYEITPPDTQAARDLLVSIGRGDIDGSSFGFLVGKGNDSFSTDNGKTVRTIRSFSKLYDVSPVTYPAYTATSTDIEVRSYKEYTEQEKNKLNLLRLRLSTYT